MSGRADIEAVAGHQLVKSFTVLIGNLVPDLTGWGYRFTAWSELDDTVLIEAAVDPGDEPTVEGQDAMLLLDISASDMAAVVFTRPALERTIPVRRLPYRLVLIDPDDGEIEILHGFLAVRAKVASA